MKQLIRLFFDYASIGKVIGLTMFGLSAGVVLGGIWEESNTVIGRYDDQESGQS